MNDPREIIARTPMHRHQYSVVAIGAVLTALDGYDVLSIAFASPGLAADWGIDRIALGVVLSMELVGMGIGSIVLGSMADRIGRRPAILASLVMMAAGMALAAIATDVIMLSAFRMFTGLGLGGLLATTNALVAEYANDRRRDLCIAIMVSGYPAGAILGGSVASFLLASTGRWQAVFEFGALISLACIPLVYWLVPETIAFLYARQPRNALQSINRNLARQGREPISVLGKPEARLLRDRPGEVFALPFRRITLILIAAYSMHILPFYFLMKWAPKIVVDHGFTAASAGIVLVWANVGATLGSWAMSLLSQIIPVRRLTIVAMVGSVVAVTAFGQPYETLLAFSVTAAAAGFFTCGTVAGLYAVFAQSFPTRLRAGGTGIVIGIGRGAAVLGPILAGFLFSLEFPLGWVAFAIAANSFVAALFLMALPKPLESPERSQVAAI